MATPAREDTSEGARRHELGCLRVARPKPSVDAQPRVIVAVSDLHCGSTYGLLPPGLVSTEGNELVQNRLQRWLWTAWCDLLWGVVPAIVGDDPWILLVNGDAIEGNHHGTRELVTPEDADHLEAAIAVIKPLADRAAVTYVVEGTECHTRHYEHGLGRAVGAAPEPLTGRRAWPKLRINVAGVEVTAHHHIGTTSRAWLESGELGRALANERLEAGAVGLPLPSVLICSHRHRWGISQSPHGTVVVTPCWQGLTRYGRKVVPSAQLHVGAMVLDWRGLPAGSQPVVTPVVRSTTAPRSQT